MRLPRIRQTTWLSVVMAGFLAGLAVGRKWPVFTVVSLVPGLVLTALGWRRRSWLWLAGGLCLALAIGGWRGTTVRRQLAIYEALYGQMVTVQVTATTDGTYAAETRNLSFNGGSLYLVQPEQRPLPGQMKFEVRGVPAVYRGDRLEVSGKLYPAGGARQGSIKFAAARLLFRQPSRLETIRLKFVAAMQTALPEPVASFGLGILVGQRSTLPEDIKQQLSTVGLTHIIAVSGANLTIIVQFVSSKLGQRSKYQIIVLSSALIATFILVTGFEASIVRAGVVSFSSLVAWYYGRRFKPIVLLLWSAVLTTAWNPVYLWSDIGWWLSFLAFFGVLVLAPLITAFGWRRGEPRLLMPLVIESSAAQIMAGPLIMYIFQEASLISLVSNVLIVPLVPLSMLSLAIAGTAGMLVPSLAAWLAWPARTLNLYMLEMVQLLSAVPYARVKWPISLPVLLAIYGLVGATCWLMWFKTRPQYAKITDKEQVMSGHSKWSTIKRQKGAKDAARGALFTKLGNAIAIAARSGDDPEMNFALRLAVDKAKAANMPMANIQRSIDRGSGKLGGDQIQEVMYEGYGPGGVAVLVECATDNLNRTYPDVKLAFSKHGGNIAEKGAVAFQFERKGMIRVTGQGDDIMLPAIEAGAEDVQEEDDESVIYTNSKDLAKVRDSLKAAGLAITEAELTYVPLNTVEVSDAATAGKIMRLMDALENLDDVTATHTNFDIPPELLDD